ncbi:hypothetical protein BaRGS_00023593 [Batillaria attramentaria]|uniref:Uncharacterized protein n=1 Tax=Batillaria attramentaria TaxID=370345 RepID=A0ABD0KDF1_9CAEN
MQLSARTEAEPPTVSPVGYSRQVPVRKPSTKSPATPCVIPLWHFARARNARRDINCQTDKSNRLCLRSLTTADGKQYDLTGRN